jgi:hypothetical protein
MTVADVVGPLSDLDHRSQLRRAVIASTVGTTIEWYDFLLYGQMAAIVFSLRSTAGSLRALTRSI